MFSLGFNRPTIALKKNTFTVFLPWLIGFMVFLATLLLSSALIVQDISNTWTEGVTKKLSVQIILNDDLPNDERLDILERASVMISQSKGVISATPLSEKELKRLLSPWLGGELKYTSLPVPNMIDVDLDPNYNVDIDEIRSNLLQVTDNVVIDNHQVWRKKILSIVSDAKQTMYVLIIFMFIASSLIIIASTRGLMNLNLDTIKILIILGASDTFITRDFRKHSYHLSLKGSILGFMFAIGAVFVLWFNNSSTSLPIDLNAVGLIALVIPSTVFLSIVASSVTVKLTLDKLFEPKGFS